MRIPLEKSTVLKLFCFLREAERSVHRAITDPWPEFRDYYRPAKIAALQRLAATLGEALGSDFPAQGLISREQAGKSISSPGIFRYYLGHLIATRKSAWTFPVPAVAFMAVTLNRLVTLVEATQKPDPSVLISLRMDCCASEWMIESRCHGLPELRRARRIDHFHRTEWLPYVTLSDILGEDYLEETPTRQSA
jgi:hypothetical protein